MTKEQIEEAIAILRKERDNIVKDGGAPRMVFQWINRQIAQYEEMRRDTR